MFLLKQQDSHLFRYKAAILVGREQQEGCKMRMLICVTSDKMRIVRIFNAKTDPETENRILEHEKKPKPSIYQILVYQVHSLPTLLPLSQLDPYTVNRNHVKVKNYLYP